MEDLPRPEREFIRDACSWLFRLCRATVYGEVAIRRVAVFPFASEGGLGRIVFRAHAVEIEIAEPDWLKHLIETGPPILPPPQTPEQREPGVPTDQDRSRPPHLRR